MSKLTKTYLTNEYQKQGRSLATIAKETGNTVNSVRAALASANIPVRRPGRPAAPKAPWQTKKFLQEAQKNGNTIRGIAAAVGASTSCVRRTMNALGIAGRRSRNSSPASSTSSASTAN